ncbi:TPA: DNA-directed RNA polymerase subunit beta [Streptococcus equi subsp. zooepidemicus]|uniref:DNA-directed RNA polymerase subunit beta n=1 Tax=Streptococcus equi TaxID=1336 RepID=UPI0013F64435|nr:DNA-directed RNA polymerase subunit beta [Streptococcus equi]MCD3388887.1 DNA-directed RNA polymerase subunit beta [Streptococcus equi subsp. zooepidemicus]MCD3455076.1 DNA-directed RNA polymerase subunit beta [Streptococcus equi subsp. zooepidemicus]QTR94057.1 hypothetical protein IEMOCGPF_01141 [Streptococcus equi subsp. zooepidemicus]HEK9954304.1 DNA-directed RNA polymerase subunit beta [Streptococcus equi subsp. zooepidemicus]HEK9993305.1 DNA-directed RNA polymerase subunit beta [Strept
MTNGWRYVINQLALIIAIGLLGLFCLALGLVIGYSLIGDGQNPLAILSPDKWAELIHKFTGK